VKQIKTNGNSEAFTYFCRYKLFKNSYRPRIHSLEDVNGNLIADFSNNMNR